MPKPKTDLISDNFAGNSWFIHRLSEGISQAESLLCPVFQDNCFNWVLGHIVVNRNNALKVLGVSPVWEREINELYKSGSPPISSVNAVEIDLLLGYLDQSDRSLETALGELGEEDLDLVAATDRGEKPRWEHLDGYHWHETIHLGHLDMLRDLILSHRAGLNG